MFRCISILLGVILTDFYFFPIEFTFFPGINTKLAMAVLSIPLLLVNVARKQTASLDKDFFVMFLFATAVSLSSFASVVYNNTYDYTFVTYVVSMLVWLGGAYTLLRYLQRIHGYISIQTVTFYLAAVCASQCVLAVAMDRMPMISHIMSSYIVGHDTIAQMARDRIYGVGCSFDVAGIRFVAVLIAMGFILPDFIKENNSKPILIAVFLICFGLIAIVGNMISRTTVIGLVIAILYFVYLTWLYYSRSSKVNASIIKWIYGSLIVCFLSAFLWYQFSPQFRHDFQFGFEGFFSLVETGTWNVDSNNQLFRMFYMPETLKTWIIGDGYFNGTTLDPYYTGKTYKAYYMGTDVGYLRFIYYSGLIGLVAFVIFILKSIRICMKHFPAYKPLFFFLFVSQMIIWIKVSSDLFAAIALYLALAFINGGNFQKCQFEMTEISGGKVR